MVFVLRSIIGDGQTFIIIPRNVGQTFRRYLYYIRV